MLSGLYAFLYSLFEILEKEARPLWPTIKFFLSFFFLTEILLSSTANKWRYDIFLVLFFIWAQFFSMDLNLHEKIKEEHPFNGKPLPILILLFYLILLGLVLGGSFTLIFIFLRNGVIDSINRIHEFLEYYTFPRII